MRGTTPDGISLGSQARDVEHGRTAAQLFGQDEILEFSGFDDVRHSHNWSLASRIWVTFMLAMFNLVVTISSSVFGSAQAKVADQFGVNEEVAVLGTSLFLVVGVHYIYSQNTHEAKVILIGSLPDRVI